MEIELQIFYLMIIDFISRVNETNNHEFFLLMQRKVVKKGWNYTLGYFEVPLASILTLLASILILFSLRGRSDYMRWHCMLFLRDTIAFINFIYSFYKQICECFKTQNKKATKFLFIMFCWTPIIFIIMLICKTSCCKLIVVLTFSHSKTSYLHHQLYTKSL